MDTLNLEPLEPPIWAQGGHAQTVMGHILPQTPLRQKGRKVEIPLPDGDRLVAFVQAGSADFVTYLFHGLAGSTDSTYMHRTSRVLQQLGHTVIMVNHRGCGEGAGMASRPYHSGRGEDLSEVIAFGRRHFPQRRHLAIGFSLSANALLVLLSGLRGQTLPDAAIAVNAPIDLEPCAYLLKVGFNRVYDVRFYLQCRKDALSALAVKGETRDFPRLATLHDFDNLYTAPEAGFLNREDYYRQCSTLDHLGKIKTPTVILTAADDPFVPVSGYRRSLVSPSVHLHIESRGGHMGYISRRKTPLGTNRWLDYALANSVAYLEPRAMGKPNL